MIAEQKARTIAKHEVRRGLETGDSPFAPWPDGMVGQPVVVHDVHGRPSYWLVPFTTDDHAVGFIRILGTGRIAAAGTFCIRADQIDKCPKVVTGLTADQANRTLKAAMRLESDETAAEPIFVHDGPIGRETWLVKIRRNEERPHRWVFITASGYYERIAGQVLEEDLEA